MFRVNEATAELFIYDDIGPEFMGMISDAMIVDALSLFEGQRVTARINSQGGDVFIGNSILRSLQIVHKLTISGTIR